MWSTQHYYLKNCATGAFLTCDEDGQLSAISKRNRCGVCTWQIRPNEEGTVTLVSSHNVRTLHSLDTTSTSTTTDGGVGSGGATTSAASPAVATAATAAGSAGNGTPSSSACWHIERFGGHIIGLRDVRRRWLGIALLPVEAYANRSSDPSGEVTATAADAPQSPPAPTSTSSLPTFDPSWEDAKSHPVLLCKSGLGQAEAWELQRVRGWAALPHAGWELIKRSLSF